MDHDPIIADDELQPLFAGLQRYSLVVLAVSGGSDSTALMHLVAAWLQSQRAANGAAPRVLVATVDHRLRDASRPEAEAVAAAAAKLGFAHHLLTWHEGAAGAGLQARARAARYDLFTALLQSLGEAPSALITAHTADDQAETLLMRLARGSGLDGLAGMRPVRPLREGTTFDLVRPLLRVPKRRLIATLQAGGIAWSEDPSNVRTEFERVRLRAAAETLTGLGLTAEMLSLSAERLGRARAAIDDAVADFERQVLDLHDGAYATIVRSGLTSVPAEVRIRLLARVLSRFGGAAPRARLSKVEALADKLAGSGKFTATLGGCVVSASGGVVRVFREPGRAGMPEAVVPSDHVIVWDGRFSVFQASGEAGGRRFTVRALGEKAFAALRRESGRDLPSRAGATLPAIWDDDTLLAVPLLGVKTRAGARFSGFRTEFLGLPADERISD